MKHLFGADAFLGNSSGLTAALREAHAELAAMQAALKTALERETVWRHRCQLLERQLTRRR